MLENLESVSSLDNYSLYVITKVHSWHIYLLVLQQLLCSDSVDVYLFSKDTTSFEWLRRTLDDSELQISMEQSDAA